MVLIGGKGTLVGPLLGALLVTFLEEYLREAKELRLSLFGLAVMAIVLFMPKGLMGFLTLRRESRGRTPTVNGPTGPVGSPPATAPSSTPVAAVRHWPCAACPRPSED
ncbi:ABC-type branched-chain amino acid transport system, permease component [Mycobacteroides abscessus subsp. abscessus]|nr:ABC-type branched-chain amino acid transport system, permease component [Mycobacteroides abscessus subsp. abscessus]